MRQPLAVTDEDKRAAWNTLHHDPEFPHHPIFPPKDDLDDHLLEGLARVITEDRKRVIEREAQT